MLRGLKLGVNTVEDDHMQLAPVNLIYGIVVRSICSTWQRNGRRWQKNYARVWPALYRSA